MKIAPLVLSLAGFAVVGTLLAAALPGSLRAPVAEAPVPPSPKPVRVAAIAPVDAPKPFVVPPKPAPAPTPTPAAAVQTATPPAAAAAAAPPIAAPVKPEFAHLVAPVALYPDALLAEILTASAYPFDIVEAARWVAEPAHRALRDGALAASLRDQHWDRSVTALVAFPDLLQAMAARIDWTRKLGDAAFGERAALLASVQQLRQAALNAGTLNKGGSCQCEVHAAAGIVTIVPARPDAVHVPVYNPAVAFGAWPYPPAPTALPLPARGVVAEVAAYGPLWGWAWIDWPRHALAFDTARYAAIPGVHRAEPARTAAVKKAAPAKHLAERHAKRTVVAAHRPTPRPAPSWEAAMPRYPGYAPYPPMPPQVAMGGPYGYYGYGR